MEDDADLGHRDRFGRLRTERVFDGAGGDADALLALQALKLTDKDVTITSVCQSTSRPWKRLSWRATAWRSSGTPIIGGYWFGRSSRKA